MTRWRFHLIIAMFLVGRPPAMADVRSITGPLPRNVSLDFPSIDGISGRLFLRLTSPALSGTMLTLGTTRVESSLPPTARLPKPSHLIVAFTVQVSQAIRALIFPQWRINVPKGMTLKPPYGVEVFVERSGQAQSRESYAATAQGSVIVTQTRTCQSPRARNGVVCAAEQYIPGSIYVFEILQNPPLSQVPRPFIPH
jgi:hypothetical protein